MVEQAPAVGHLTGDVGAHEDALEFAADGVLRIEHGDVAVHQVRGFADAVPDVARNKFALFQKGVKCHAAHSAAGFLRSDGAVKQGVVVGDEQARQAQNFRRGSVVFLQDNRRVALEKLALKLRDVFGRGVPPAVDGLLVVCHHKDAAMPRGQEADQRVLHRVRVLKFIDEEVLKLRAVRR